eukprot:s1187_g15.t1
MQRCVSLANPGGVLRSGDFSSLEQDRRIGGLENGGYMEVEWYFFGPSSWQLPQRQDLSSFTSRSLLNDHSCLASEVALRGRAGLRKELQDVPWNGAKDGVLGDHEMRQGPKPQVQKLKHLQWKQ